MFDAGPDWNRLRWIDAHIAGASPIAHQLISQGHGGAYAGILSGYSRGADSELGIGLVVGNTFSAADLLLGVEAVAFAASRGEVTLEGALRAGFGLTDTIVVFGAARLGHSFDTDTFVSVGAALDADVGDGWFGSITGTTTT